MKGTKLYRGRYTLEEEIGHGGFATIYRASEQEQREPVAIKVATASDDPSYGKSVREEAKIIQRFEHQNIVQLRPIPRFDKEGEVFYANALDIPGNPVFFVMEYLQGGTLDAYLKQVEKLSVPEAAAIGLQVARALDHMHQREYAHNDLKLENIVFRQPVVVGEPFTAVLIDFGIATRIAPPGAGSLYIMPPEQAATVNMMTPPEVSEPLDRTKVDVWGLGVVLYRMLGGQLPFSGRNERDTVQRICNSRPTALSQLDEDIPPEMDKFVIDGCLAKSPDHRLDLLEVGRWLKSIAGNGVVARRSADAGKPTGIFGRLFGR